MIDLSAFFFSVLFFCCVCLPHHTPSPFSEPHPALFFDCMTMTSRTFPRTFAEGSNTQEQDYRYSWTPSTTNPSSGLFEASGGPDAMYNGTKANPRWAALVHSCAGCGGPELMR